MIKLTPPTQEQCALIDEAARQLKTGETKAEYWHWFRHHDPRRSFFKFPNYDQCAPAPAHPHYATYCNWQQLVDAGEVAKGFWSIYTSVKIEGCLGTSGTTIEPKWFPEFDYEIRKTDKHPDNCKPALKLIDWVNIPVGTMTNKDEFLGFHGSTIPGRDSAVLLKKMVLIGSELDSLRIAEQTKFTYWGGGDCPVPDGVMVEVIFRNRIKTSISGSSLYWNYARTKNDSYGDIIAYRILGLADGWTDDPSKAAV